MRRLKKFCFSDAPMRVEALELVPNDDKDTCVAVTMLAQRLASSGAETDFIERTAGEALAALGVSDVMVRVTSVKTGKKSLTGGVCFSCRSAPYHRVLNSSLRNAPGACA